MTGLRDILERHVSSGSLPGAVGLVARGDQVEVEAVGSADVEGTAPMVRDSIFRIASLTKPVTAAAVMMLVEEGRFALEDPVEPWLPELASRVAVRTPASPVDDVVPAARPITVFDLLTFRAGYGFPSDFSLPAVGLLVSELKQGPPQPQHIAGPDAWMKALSGIPLLYQPGEAWLYNTCSDILGVLIARVSGQSLPSSWPSGSSSRWAWRTPGSPSCRQTWAGSRASTAGATAASNWPTPPTGSGAASRPSPPAPAAWSGPPTTGTRSAG